MKTTLNIDDQLLIEAKSVAAQQRTTLTRLIEEGLRLRLHAQARRRSPRKIQLPAFNGQQGMVAGVDPLSNRSMLQAIGDDA